MLAGGDNMKKAICLLIAILFTLSSCGASKTFKQNAIFNHYGVKHEAYIYNYNTFNIIVLKDMDKSKQLLNVHDIVPLMMRTPLEFRENVQYIMLLDYSSPCSEQHKKTYGDSFEAIAGYVDNKIMLYENGKYSGNPILKEQADTYNVYETNPDIKDMFPRILTHEIAHSFDDMHKFSETWEFRNIVVHDEQTIYLYDYVINFREEFAETVAIYLTQPEYLKENYSYRYEYMDKLLKQYGFK